MAGRHLRWTGVAAILVLLAGFGLSLILGMHGVAQLGMLHLPAAWLSLLLMLVVAFWSVVGIISGSRLPCLIAQSVAPTGGMFTFLALWSGSLWMRAVEGVWWLGDARQIAELALLVVYLTMLALPSILRDAESADRAIGVTALVGGSLAITLFFVVDGWLRLRGAEPPALLADTRLLWPMVLVGCGLWLYSTFVGLVRLRCLIKEREFGLSEYFAAR
jgi:heme exporter protein C